MKILSTKSTAEDRRGPAEAEVTLEEFEVKPDTLQMGLEGGRVPHEVEALIQQAIDKGAPLEGALQKQMTAGLDQDLSGVRIHIGPNADKLCRQLSARAFTIGSDIFFQRGAYAPTSLSGRRLIAHELVHVIQQRTGEVSGDENCMVVRPVDDIFEQNADAIATQVVAGGRWDSVTSVFRTQASRSFTIQRTATRMVRAANTAPPAAVAPLNHGSQNCHEFVLGCLLHAEYFTPNNWQLLRAIASQFLMPNTVATWIATHIHQPRRVLVRADVTNPGAMAPRPGDILFTSRLASNNIQHSMIVVQGVVAVAAAGPGAVPAVPTMLIRGFNNAGTFNDPTMPGGLAASAGAGVYDNTDRDIAHGYLWDPPGLNQQFGVPGARLFLHLVRYQHAANHLLAAIGFGHVVRRFAGWQHAPPIPVRPPGCAHLPCPWF